MQQFRAVHFLKTPAGAQMMSEETGRFKRRWGLAGTTLGRKSLVEAAVAMMVAIRQQIAALFHPVPAVADSGGVVRLIGEACFEV